MGIFGLIALDIFISFLIAYFLGSNKKIGFGASFIICILLSPILATVILLLLPDANEKVTCKYCGIEDEYIYYCPRCMRDIDGFTAEENKERFKEKFIYQKLNTKK